MRKGCTFVLIVCVYISVASIKFLKMVQKCVTILKFTSYSDGSGQASFCSCGCLTLSRPCLTTTKWAERGTLCVICSQNLCSSWWKEKGLKPCHCKDFSLSLSLSWFFQSDAGAEGEKRTNQEMWNKRCWAAHPIWLVLFMRLVQFAASTTWTGFRARIVHDCLATSWPQGSFTRTYSSYFTKFLVFGWHGDHAVRLTQRFRTKFTAKREEIRWSAAKNRQKIQFRNRWVCMHAGGSSSRFLIFWFLSSVTHTVCGVWDCLSVELSVVKKYVSLIHLYTIIYVADMARELCVESR